MTSTKPGRALEDSAVSYRGASWGNSPRRGAKGSLHSRIHQIHQQQRCVTPALCTPSQLRAAWHQKQSPKVPSRVMPGSWAHAMRSWAISLLLLDEIAADLTCQDYGAVLLSSIIKLSFVFCPNIECNTRE